MSDSLVQGLHNGRPVPQNHSIGKNGSFWLPKNIAEQGTNHKQRANQTKSQKTPTESKSSNNSSKVKQNSLETQNKPNFEKSILSAKKNISESRLLQSSKSVFNKKTSSSPQSSSKGRNHLTLQSNSLKQSFSLLKNVVVTVNHKEDSKSVLNQPILNRHNQKDQGMENNDKDNRNRGTKHALKGNEMEETLKKSSNPVTTESSLVHTESSSVSKFTSLVGRALAPRVAYSNKHAKKIVRFAVDLPNGCKLGVRLEKSEAGISVCFISPQKEIRSLLNVCKESISSSVQKDSNTQLKIKIFPDYQSMDNHHRLVA
ncbi:MAG: hypothetical protein CMI23_03165 [Opitutae bacterium]|nr:hypothetical protein [Opitutae bacterium]